MRTIVTNVSCRRWLRVLKSKLEQGRGRWLTCESYLNAQTRISHSCPDNKLRWNHSPETTVIISVALLSQCWHEMRYTLLILVGNWTAWRTMRSSNGNNAKCLTWLVLGEMAQSSQNWKAHTLLKPEYTGNRTRCVNFHYCCCACHLNIAVSLYSYWKWATSLSTDISSN